MKIFLLLLLAISSLFSQKITLEDAIEKAINTHPDIQRFILQVDTKKSSVDVATADYLPQINFNAEYNLTF